MFEALKHHKDVVMRCFPGITDLEDARVVARYKWIPNLLKRCWADTGRRVYANMDIDNIREVFAQLIVSVNTDQVVIIPDTTPDGRRNHDIICEYCGNKNPLPVDGYTCEVDRIDAWLSRRSRLINIGCANTRDLPSKWKPISNSMEPNNNSLPDPQIGRCFSQKLVKCNELKVFNTYTINNVEPCIKTKSQ